MQRGEVLRGRIALVRVETVVRERLVQRAHVGVAGDLGEDRRGHDRAVARIAADPRLARPAQAARHDVAVDAGDVGHMRDGVERAAHAGESRLQDIDAVDLVDLDQDHVPRQRAFDDARVQRLAACGVELLGIIESVDGRASRREHHGRDRDRPGQGAATGLVDAGDARQPGRGGKELGLGAGGHARSGNGTMARQ